MSLHTIGFITIEITKLSKYDDIAFNSEGNNYTYMWKHYSGLGTLSPNCGLAHSKEEAIEQATLIIKSCNLDYK